jgi:hypothetical protein
VRNRFRLWSSVEARQRFGDDPIARRGRGLDERYVAHMEARLSRSSVGLMAVAWPLVWVNVVAVRGAVRAFAGFATVGHAHIRGLGTPRPVFVARPLSKVERARRGGGCSGDESRSCVREPGSSGRLASRNGLWVISA